MRGEGRWREGSKKKEDESQLYKWSGDVLLYLNLIQGSQEVDMAASRGTEDRATYNKLVHQDWEFLLSERLLNRQKKGITPNYGILYVSINGELKPPHIHRRPGGSVAHMIELYLCLCQGSVAMSRQSSLSADVEFNLWEWRAAVQVTVQR